MCGIFGWQLHTRMTDRQSSALATALMLYNETRGEHSWGYADSAGVTRKGLGKISDNVRAEDLAVYDALIVHTRFKTQGAITLENAHPFTHGSVTGAHNGCLWNAHELDKAYGRDFEVDSMHIFEHLDKGLDLSDLVGYGAIEYIDARNPGAIFVGTFESGELAVARIRGKGIVWSSDRNALKSACAVANAKIEKFYKIKPMHLYCMAAGRFFDTGFTMNVADWYNDKGKMPAHLDEAFDYPDPSTAELHEALDEDMRFAEQMDEDRRQYGTETQSLRDYYQEQERALAPKKERVRLVEDMSKRNGGSRTFYLQEGR